MTDAGGGGAGGGSNTSLKMGGGGGGGGLPPAPLWSPCVDIMVKKHNIYRVGCPAPGR